MLPSASHAVLETSAACLCLDKVPEQASLPLLFEPMAFSLDVGGSNVVQEPIENGGCQHLVCEETVLLAISQPT